MNLNDTIEINYRSISKGITVENLRYHIHMRRGHRQEVWALCGKVYNHPNFKDGSECFLSVPVEFDGETLKTISGREYYIGSWGIAKEETIKHIKIDIANGHYGKI